MKAKLIYEKFKENSDPIDDLDIGSSGYSAYEVWVIGSVNMGDIEEIFLSRPKAERIAKQRNLDYYNEIRNRHKEMSEEEFKKYFSINNKHYILKVWNLIDAMDQIIQNSKEYY